MKNKILWPVLFLCTLPVQAQQDMTEAEGSVTLQECLSRGLESNFSIRMVKNQQETAANNATRANAGMLPTVDLSASYSGDLGSTRTTPRSTGVTTTERGAYDGTVDAGIDLNYFRRLQRVDQLQATATPERTGRTANPHYDRRLCGIAHSRILQLHTGKNPFEKLPLCHVPIAGTHAYRGSQIPHR